MHRAVVSVLVLVLLSGCISEETSDRGPDLSPAVEASTPRPVVVAVIDSGINVYHDHFQRDVPVAPDALATFVNTLDDAQPAVIEITREGDYDERLEADEAVWANMTEHTLYHFNGTNVLGISFDDRDDHPVLDDGSHGTGTSAAVFNADPNVLVVLVEGIGPDAEAWAASQPWIDVVSMSYGPPGSAPETGPLMGLTTSEATKLMWDSGKLPIGAADNSPALSTFDETAGPPWVIGVAGDHEPGCRETSSGSLPDFTSDFTQELPGARTVEDNRSASGTSFATPRTAGSFASAVRELRELYGAPPAASAAGILSNGPNNTTLTNVDVRAAFERAARYYEADPSCLQKTMLPVAPWVQQGWGHVGPEVVADAVAVLTGDPSAPEKSAEARQWNGQTMALREAYWGS